MIQDRLKALRSEMAKRGISLYVVPTADFHESEYVGEHFKARKYITGSRAQQVPQSSLWMRPDYGQTAGILCRRLRSLRIPL